METTATSQILTPKEIKEIYSLDYSTVINLLNTARGKKLILPRKHGQRYRITSKNFERLINNE